MRECNVCRRERPNKKYVHEGKLTCKKCETSRWKSFLRVLVLAKNLTAVERLSNRIGYMGTSFIMLSPYLLKYDNLGAYTYIAGACLSIPQVFIAKQWNLVAVNVNLLIGYGLYILNT